jgi:ABC-type dipeptide/oligopeptide/nickel transport system ATPase subunit
MAPYLSWTLSQPVREYNFSPRAEPPALTFGSDKTLAGISRIKIQAQLREVGFDDARQADIVGGLSGGWKMKLELARAMLYNADLLLLDEVGVHPPSNCTSPDLPHVAY